MSIKIIGLIKYIKKHNLILATCESCTGGMLGAEIVSKPGASKYYYGGLITYMDKAKAELLGFHIKNVKKWGAVSLEMAQLMALYTFKKTNADINISITGYTGPGDGSRIGEIYIGIYTKWDNKNRYISLKLTGTRNKIRQQIVDYVLYKLF